MLLGFPRQLVVARSQWEPDLTPFYESISNNNNNNNNNDNNNNNNNNNNKNNNKNNNNVTYITFSYNVLITAASVSSQCQQCFEDNETECIQRQRLEDCGPDSLGTTHCGFAKIKFLFNLSIRRNAVYKGCINCAGNIRGTIYHVRIAYNRPY